MLAVAALAGVATLLGVTQVVYMTERLEAGVIDYRLNLHDAGQRALDGLSPYPTPDGMAAGTENPAIWPPPIVVVAAPLAEAPFTVAPQCG